MEMGAKGPESVIHRVGTDWYDAKTTVPYLHRVISLPSETSVTFCLSTG
jgi:hypothetical protein